MPIFKDILKTLLSCIAFFLVEVLRVFLTLSLLFFPLPCYLLPTNQRVVHGEVQFNQNGSHLEILNSPNAIIEYDQFNIGSHESVFFIQESQNSRVLNRVLGKDASWIHGQLFSNGHVYLINPSGIYFGPSALVDVAAFYAAAGSLSNEDFLSHLNRFTHLQSPIENQGHIMSNAVSLLGRSVSNTGSIYVPDGTVSLLAGDEIILTEQGGHIFVSYDMSLEEKILNYIGVDQSGTIDAEKGEVTLATGDLFYAP